MFLSLVVTGLMVSTVSIPFEAWRADPAIEMRDAYKWLYQATHGGEHAAPSRAAAEQWLLREWEELGAPLPDEPLVEPLGTSSIVRVNLRPYRLAGGDRSALLSAFLSSAAAFRPDRSAFERMWLALGERLRQNTLGQLTRAGWEQLDAETRPHGYPAVHHSDTYARTRRPAYRVLTAEQARTLVAALGANPIPVSRSEWPALGLIPAETPPAEGTCGAR